MGVDYLPVTRLCVHRGPQPLVCSGHHAETWTPCRPLEPLCTRYSYRRSPPTPPASPPSIHLCYVFPFAFLSPPSPPSVLTSTPFLTHQPPCPHHAAIPLPCHLAAFRRPCTQKPIVCAGRRQKAPEREMVQRNKLNSVFLLDIHTYSQL